MMAINRYRLKHRADSGHRSAVRVRMLLEMPERLIGVILIGNNLVNIAASALTTVIAIRLYPENPNLAITFATGMLTLIVLIFAEVTPKTMAQKHPEGIAYPASWILRPLLVVLYPAVVFVNSVSRGIMWLFKVRVTPQNHEALNADELRTMVSASGSSLAAKRQNMLLGILDLDNVSVEDIMIPRNELAGINLDDKVEDIRSQLNNTPYTRLPIYKGDLDRVIGFLHIRDAAEFLTSDQPTKVMLSRKATAPYFVPETTPLQTQLVNFQRKKIRIGLVVDEYGDVQGLVTLDDILEEIVGEFTTDVADNNKDIHPQSDGSYLIDGAASIRDINRILDWSLPADGAKTLSGLVIEQLEDIPDANMSLRIEGYQVEILQVSNNTITAAKLREL
ncbi:HlyC/CorC family transporter [Natronospirillum operosum]|uniref:HlyC/CorC family transporter n=2 Tax=Natronospirillum operosum TaxID=2759953 RepID=A0A4Z0WGA5_9GAMM|nr:HlyC/CorC family transporter [Natronospirillum operosum]